jgi:hypothetical protein
VASYRTRLAAKLRVISGHSTAMGQCGLLSRFAVGTELFSRSGVHYLSGFYGPLEQVLGDAGANIRFAPADFRRFAPRSSGSHHA